jgi:hypothetical protein
MPYLLCIYRRKDESSLPHAIIMHDPMSPRMYDRSAGNPAGDPYYDSHYAAAIPPPSDSYPDVDPYQKPYPYHSRDGRFATAAEPYPPSKFVFDRFLLCMKLDEMISLSNLDPSYGRYQANGRSFSSQTDSYATRQSPMYGMAPYPPSVGRPYGAQQRA